MGLINPSSAAAPGDITTTSFSAANNQIAPANVTGLSFSNSLTRSFTANVAISLIATSNSYENVTLNAIQRSADWQMVAQSAGDISGVVFSITTGGQIQYTSPNSTGFVSNTIKFRASTVSV